MQPYPLAVRKQIVRKYQAGLDTQDIADDYGYCVAGVRRVWQVFRETGSVEPKPRNAGRKARFDEAGLKRLSDEVAKKPDATLAELKASVGVDADLSCYCRALKKVGLSRKKSRSTRPSRRGRT